MFKRVLIILVLVFCSLEGFSQACDPELDPFCEDIDTPIDGGLSLLIAAGTLYGIKRIRENRRDSIRGIQEYSRKL